MFVVGHAATSGFHPHEQSLEAKVITGPRYAGRHVCDAAI
jgi:hypothetical protein